MKNKRYRSRLITDKIFIDLTTKIVQLTPPELLIRVVFLTEGGEHGYVNENGAETDLCDEILKNLGTIPITRRDQVNCELRMGKKPKDTMDAFFTLATADIVITSKSGFSHLAAVVSSGVKVIIPFWVVLNGISRVVPVQVHGDIGVFNETLFKSSLSDYMKQKRVKLSHNITDSGR